MRRAGRGSQGQFQVSVNCWENLNEKLVFEQIPEGGEERAMKRSE